MVEIGNYNELEIVRQVEFGVYLGSEDGDILLPGKYVPLDARVGDKLRVFVYRDSEDRMIATTLQPKATVGEFAALTVKDTNAYGSFLDWGLEKDLFVPFHNQKERMRPGQKYVVYLYLDDTSDRIVGTTKLGKFLQEPDDALQPGQAVDLLVAGSTDLGYKVIINNKYMGMLYRNEVFRPLSTGQHAQGFIKQLRPDGKIDVSLQQQGYSEVASAADRILVAVRNSGGSLYLTDNSSPEEIKEQLGMSKKIFKKAVGSLYKNGEIVLEQDHIRLAR